MGGDGLGRLKVAAFVEINRNPRSTERVRGYFRADAGAPCTSLDHTEHVVAVHPIGCDVAGTINRPEEGRLRLRGDVGGGYISVEVSLENVVDGHLMKLASFLVES